jgi:2-hydroxychromene-2-carboxylate isomerase
MGAMPRTVDFYFDFMSPYAYLAHHRLVGVTRRLGWEVDYRPVDLAQAKLAVGNTGPANREIPIKHRYLRTDLRRWADLYGVPFVPPAGYGSERVNRGAFYAIDRNCAEAYSALAWRRIWGEGTAMNSDDLLREIGHSMGWDVQDLLRYTQSEAAIRRLHASNEAATQRGVFGVPTMAIGDEIWWGNDRMDFVERHMNNFFEIASEPQ